jgi:hypothetical protein
LKRLAAFVSHRDRIGEQAGVRYTDFQASGAEIIGDILIALKDRGFVTSVPKHRSSPGFTGELQ